MKAAIKNPYLDTFGGGERYTLSFVKILLDLGYDVDLEWTEPSIIKKLESRFGMKFQKLNVVSDIKRGDGYDICFWVSDGSIPALKARKNILHFQVPFHHTGGNNLINKMKLFRVDHVVCNSYFTKNIIDYEYGVESTVVYPPVDTNTFKAKRKDKTILFVGRFSSLLQSKGQETLVTEFKKLCDLGYRDWTLVLAGGVEIGSEDKINKLEKESTTGYPIKIFKSPSLKQLKDLYGSAKIFWSASGYGVDQDKDPEKVEHFGLSLVESMSAGCCPIVYNAGGYKEIVDNKTNGFLWNNTEELISITERMINDSKKCREISKESQISAEKYSYDKFKEKFTSLIK